MGFLYSGGKRSVVHHKPMILAGDLNSAGSKFLHRMVGPAMPMVHLFRLRAKGQGEELMAQAYPEKRDFRIQDFADCRHGGFSSGLRIAGTVGEEDALGSVGHDFRK